MDESKQHIVSASILVSSSMIWDLRMRTSLIHINFKVANKTFGIVLCLAIIVQAIKKFKFAVHSSRYPHEEVSTLSQIGSSSRDAVANYQHRRWRIEEA